MTRREKRKRDYIKLGELLASALADKLTQDERDILRAKGKEGLCSADDVIALFTPDHNHLHALGGPDVWWNLTMTRRGPELKKKDARDTSIVAKNDRLAKGQADWNARMNERLIGPSPFMEVTRDRREKPKRRIQSRPFPTRQQRAKPRRRRT